MLKIINSGCLGRMGQTVSRLVSQTEDLSVCAGVDQSASGNSAPYPIYSALSQVVEEADVLIDFSNPSALDEILRWCGEKGVPAILCTTGYSDTQLEQIREASERFPVFRSGNMSLGINLLSRLVKTAAGVLGEDFDIEIIEKHHNKKLDAPSGTAIMLADAAASVRCDSEYVYDRHSVRRARDKREIGISAVRGGTIVGEHEVLFCGEQEVISLSHSAGSREVFAAGAVRAARFMASVQKPGLYSMDDVFAAMGL